MGFSKKYQLISLIVAWTCAFYIIETFCLAELLIGLLRLKITTVKKNAMKSWTFCVILPLILKLFHCECFHCEVLTRVMVEQMSTHLHFPGGNSFTTFENRFLLTELDLIMKRKES